MGSKSTKESNKVVEIKNAAASTEGYEGRTESEIEEMEEKRMEEMAERQKESVNHVVENLFPYTPVKINLQKYPKDSPKHGQAYLWVTVDKALLQKKVGFLEAEQSVTKYPVGVAIDADGDVYVSNPASLSSPTNSSPARKIAAKSIMTMAANKDSVPAQMNPPRFVEATKNSIKISWKEGKAIIVDRFEVQYRFIRRGEEHFRIDDNDLTKNKTLASSISTRLSVLENIKPFEGYVFRVRAHNPSGWGEYSSWSSIYRSLSGPPSPMKPPFPGVISSTYICMYWIPAVENGARITRYFLEAKRKKKTNEDNKPEDYNVVYTGTECNFLVPNLNPSSVYFFRICAHSDAGNCAWVESSAIKTLITEAPAPVQVQELPTEIKTERWIQCWDPKTERIFYFNKFTCQRTVDEPKEIEEVRVKSNLGAEKIETPDMLFRKKRFHFLREIRKGFSQNAVLDVKLRRDFMYDDTFKKFQRLGKKDLHLKPKIIFENEEGIDSGGLTKDWYLQVSKDILSKEKNLFVKNAEGYISIDSDSFRNQNHLKHFRFVGKFVAKAIFDRQLVDLPFGEIVFKHMLGMEVGFDDLKVMDPQFYKSLEWIIENNITDIIYETFSVERHEVSGITIIDLKEDGQNIDVTESNKSEYIDLMIKWRTEFAIRPQLDALLQGFHTLVPHETIANFSLPEFKLLVNGKDSIDVDEIRASVVFQGGYDINSRAVLWLWQALREFNQENRGLFLKFSTGTNKIPLDGFDPPFNITKSDLEYDALPRTHTCFNQFVLPDYQEYNVLVDKVLFAILNTEGFGLS